jgi:hypothetical protein
MAGAAAAGLGGPIRMYQTPKPPATTPASIRPAARIRTFRLLRKRLPAGVEIAVMVCLESGRTPESWDRARRGSKLRVRA